MCTLELEGKYLRKQGNLQQWEIDCKGREKQGREVEWCRIKADWLRGREGAWRWHASKKASFRGESLHTLQHYELPSYRGSGPSCKFLGRQSLLKFRDLRPRFRSWSDVYHRGTPRRLATC